MQTPLRIDFNHMQPPFGADDLIRDGAAELQRCFGPITACRVAVEKRHLAHQRGNLYHLRIELIVRGRIVVVHREPPQDCIHECLQFAIADGFATARCRLHDHVDELLNAAPRAAPPTGPSRPATHRLALQP